jgi:polysaccharide deacetylase family protein (PEP-CTERM system associated)
MLNALTFDVEEHFQVRNLETAVRRVDWDRHPSRVVESTRRVLQVLADHDVRATFFVLGWIADRRPRLLDEIADGGHEIATHGYGHELVYRQKRHQFAQDLTRSLNAIEAATGIRPIGFRAPEFSITARTRWAMDVLHEQGIVYDSSIVPPAVHQRDGIRDACRFATRWANGVWEFPVSTVRLAGQNWPVAGGSYFRLYPLWITRQAVRHLNVGGSPAMVYLHPWELDPDQPRMSRIPALSRFQHYANLSETEGRLRALLREFAFGPVREVFASQLGTEPATRRRAVGAVDGAAVPRGVVGHA